MRPSFVDLHMIDLFLEHHGIDSIAENIDRVSRLETIISLYDLMIAVFREGSILEFRRINSSFSQAIAFLFY